mmetsp:Transcript_8250/g.21119  ORF Transcript_8250/g.21119 Transcript_8250/m.21119 type:complete len:310 (+) Transcript_8250:344-1273(+)
MNLMRSWSTLKSQLGQRAAIASLRWKDPRPAFVKNSSKPKVEVHSQCPASGVGKPPSTSASSSITFATSALSSTVFIVSPVASTAEAASANIEPRGEMVGSSALTGCGFQGDCCLNSAGNFVGEALISLSCPRVGDSSVGCSPSSWFCPNCTARSWLCCSDNAFSAKAKDLILVRPWEPSVSAVEAPPSVNQVAMWSSSAPNEDMEASRGPWACPETARESRIAPVICERFVSVNSFWWSLPMSSVIGTVTEPQKTSLRIRFWFQTETVMLPGSSSDRTAQLTSQLGRLCAHIAAPVRCTSLPSTVTTT